MQRPALPAHAHWWVLAVGLAGLYIPSLWDLAQGLWASPEQGHGPIILAVSAWLFYNHRHALAALTPKPLLGPGFGLLALGLVVYVVGDHSRFCCWPWAPNFWC